MINNDEAISPREQEKVLQFQDITGIEDTNRAKDILIRNNWDVEVAIQEVTIHIHTLVADYIQH